VEVPRETKTRKISVGFWVCCPRGIDTSAKTPTTSKHQHQEKTTTMTKLNLWAMNKLAEIRSQEEGQGLVEYALIIALVAVLLVGALTALQGGISGTFSDITGSL
jgi:pilus assembly protein Flp/PilA